MSGVFRLTSQISSYTYLIFSNSIKILLHEIIFNNFYRGFYYFLPDNADVMQERKGGG